jgi:hypothetical protein
MIRHHALTASRARRARSRRSPCPRLTGARHGRRCPSGFRAHPVGSARRHREAMRCCPSSRHAARCDRRDAASAPRPDTTSRRARPDRTIVRRLRSASQIGDPASDCWRDWSAGTGGCPCPGWSAAGPAACFPGPVPLRLGVDLWAARDAGNRRVRLFSPPLRGSSRPLRSQKSPCARVLRWRSGRARFQCRWGAVPASRAAHRGPPSQGDGPLGEPLGGLTS